MLSLLPRVAPRAFDWMASRVIAVAQKTPYTHLGDYMHRWWLAGQPKDSESAGWAVRVHHILRSDHDRALHDHPWNNASLVLRGGYWEVTPGLYQRDFEMCGGNVGQLPDWSQAVHAAVTQAQGGHFSRGGIEDLASAGVFWRGPGSFVSREAETLHRLVLPAGTTAWSLFFMAPKRREWGFVDPERGWVHNRIYERGPQEQM